MRRIGDHAGLGDISGVSRVRLMEEAERLKIALSADERAVFRLPFFDGAHSIEQEITRDELEQLAAPWIARTLRHCRHALADAALTPADLDAVVVVGGNTRMPAVRRAVAGLFGRAPDISQHPDEAIALGAMIQGGVLGGALQQMVLLDFTTLSLGIETFAHVLKPNPRFPLSP
jgi:molecular chaperone DnaK